jgi:hypothetical protein
VCVLCIPLSVHGADVVGGPALRSGYQDPAMS